KTISIKVSPSEWPEQEQTVTQVKSPPAPKSIPVELGITIKPLTPALALQFGSAALEGVLVATVDRNSPASRSGLKPGDIITSIDQQPIGNRKQFQAAVEKAD